MNLSDLNIDNSWTLFVDRDGVINRRLVGDYVKRWEEFEPLPRTSEAFRLLSMLFKRVVVVTNQQGIGKGLMTENDLQVIHQNFIHAIGVSGGRIDAIYHAPQLKQENHPMRKPNTGMVKQAMVDFPDIDPAKCILVGDSLSDMQLGRNAGMPTVLVGDERDEIEAAHPQMVDFVFQSLYAFAWSVRQDMNPRRPKKMPSAW